jgi:hypothetical protein
MPKPEAQKMYIATLIQSYYGKNPAPILSLTSMPNESMEQLASRMQQYQRTQGYKEGTGYHYETYLGELTHQIPPPPPPPPVKLTAIEKIPVAVPKRAGAVAKLKTIKPA